MSAFVVGHDHIDGLLTFASQRRYGSGTIYFWNNERHEITEENATEIGRKLLRENIRSVEYRYPSAEPDDLPGTIGETANGYKFKPWYLPPISAVSILKACSCYDYQACETGDYRETEAHAIIDAIRKRAISALPGYDEANGWELRRPAGAPHPAHGG